MPTILGVLPVRADGRAAQADDRARAASPSPLLTGLALATLLCLQGCASGRPAEEAYAPYRERAQTQTAGDLSVTLSVPTAAEAEEIYGVDLFGRQIQPAWIEVRNESDHPYWLIFSGLDPNYFAPSEAAYAFRESEDEEGPSALKARFNRLTFQSPVMPGSSASGFVLTNLDEGFKAVDVDLISAAEAKSFAFTTRDPTFQSVSAQVDFENLYRPEEIVYVDDEAELRRLLEALPCCTANAAGSEYGDPLNLVLIGPRDDLVAAGLRRYWHPTEIVDAGSLWRTVTSFLEGERYRYSPISPLYVFGRSQDIAMQKARATINERNHARVWLTPIRFQGEEVWIGQISRDIGVKYTLKSPTISTHVIDPDVDEARRYMLEDMAYSQSLTKMGWVAGVGAAAKEDPRYNLVGDPYYTDGLRAVMFFEHRPLSLGEIDYLGWEFPPKQRRLVQQDSDGSSGGQQ